MQNRPARSPYRGLLLSGALLATAFIIYFLPPVHERLAWRMANWQAALQRRLHPPERLVFTPQQLPTRQAVTITPTSNLTLMPVAATATPGITPTRPPSPTASAIPLPDAHQLSGARHEFQQFNNCGPTTLSMALSFWGWQGDQTVTRAFLRPNRKVDDKNVSPEEMVHFIETQTGLKALVRHNGDLDLLRRLLAAGFPVVIERGHQPANDWWMGHYVLISGYDNTVQQLTTQDSLLGPDLPLPYTEAYPNWWRDFNYVYLVIYPPEREAELLALLGPDADPQENYRRAAQRAQGESLTLQGRDQYFAFFNLGASQVALQDYPAAATAFDRAFDLYPSFSEQERPYRLLWYRVEPYAAYYHAGRYQDVINLANTTIAWVSAPVLEETYYWRGMANLALGNRQTAISDFQKAVKLNPNSTPAAGQLEALGAAIP